MQNKNQTYTHFLNKDLYFAKCTLRVELLLL